MIAFVRGRVADVGLTSAVLEVGGVGLELQCTPDTIAGLRILCNLFFKPAQCVELTPHQLLPAPTAPVDGAVLGGIFLALLGMGKVLHAACQRKFFKSRGVRAAGQIGNVDEDQARGPRLRLAPRGSRELGSNPCNRASHLASVEVFALDTQVAVPCRFRVEALNHCAHECEVAAVELAGALWTLFSHGRHFIPGGRLTEEKQAG